MGPGSSPGTGKISNQFLKKSFIFCLFWSSALTLVGGNKNLWFYVEWFTTNILSLNTYTLNSLFDFTTLHVIFIWSFVTVILSKSQ